MTATKPSKALLKDSIAFSPYLAMTFEISGALLIQQIHYWNVTNGHLKEGHRWSYNTHDEWASQLMVYGEKTIRTKLKQLEASGVVVSGCFNKHGYDRTKWYRVDYTQLTLALRAKFPDLTITPLSCGKFFRIQVEKSTGPIPETPTETNNKIKESQNTESHLSVTELEEQDHYEEESEDDENKEGYKEAMAKAKNTANEVLAKYKASKEGAIDTSKSTSHGMYQIWCKSLPRYHDSIKFVKPFSIPEMGRFSGLSKMWGAKAGDVLHLIIKHWSEYTKYAEIKSGAFKCPTAPTVAFVVKYAEPAMNFFLEKTSTKKFVAKGAIVGGVLLKKGVQNSDSSEVHNAISCTDSEPILEPATTGEEDDKPTTLDFLLKFKVKKHDKYAGNNPE